METNQDPNDPVEELPTGVNTEQLRFPWAATVGLVACTLIVAAALVLASSHVPKGSQKAEVAAAAAIENAFDGLELGAKSAIVIDITNGETLFALYPDVQLPLASLTKVPLVLVVSEVLSPSALLTIPRNIAGTGGVEPLMAGERWKIQDVIDFTLVTSSNDGAEILAEAAKGAVRSKYTGAPQDAPALWRMNELGRELGLTQTYFLNVSGLDISTTLSGAYGSARDIAHLFAYASKTNAAALSGTAHGDVLLMSENGAFQTVARNTNEAEAEIPGLILGKTGFTDLAGGNLAIVFDAGIAHPVVAVVLGSTADGRFEDMRTLVDAARTAIASQ